MPPASPVAYPPSHAIFRMEWAILSALAPLTGVRSSGSMTALASGGATTVPPGWYLVPTIRTPSGESYVDFGRMVKTTTETAVDPVADPSGTAVAFVSVSGGVRQNLDPGTVLEWYPEPPAGITSTAVTVAGSSGGTDATGPAAVRQALSWEGLGAASVAADLWKAGTDAFPAVIVAWRGASEERRVGAGKILEKHNFDVFVVATRLDGANRRRDEGKIVLSAVQREIEDRAQVDGEIFSSPPTVPGALSRLAMDPGSYTYVLALQVSHAAKRTERRAYMPLAKVRTQIVTTDDGVTQPPADPLVIVDDTEDVPT